VIGPLIDIRAVEKVEAHIAEAVKKGAKVLTDGKRAGQSGSFFDPTVTDMIIAKEETFGPVAPLYRLMTEADAAKMANDTEFGLASYFYSRNIGRIWRGRRGPRIRDRDRALRRREGRAATTGRY
jgi:succinate-semialdehyde dehydrogenase/glutarate-semialdehyde dehydrogenase